MADDNNSDQPKSKWVNRILDFLPPQTHNTVPEIGRDEAQAVAEMFKSTVVGFQGDMCDPRNSWKGSEIGTIIAAYKEAYNKLDSDEQESHPDVIEIQLAVLQRDLILFLSDKLSETLSWKEMSELLPVVTIVDSYVEEMKTALEQEKENEELDANYEKESGEASYSEDPMAKNYYETLIIGLREIDLLQDRLNKLKKKIPKEELNKYNYLGATQIEYMFNNNFPYLASDGVVYKNKMEALDNAYEQFSSTSDSQGIYVPSAFKNALNAPAFFKSTLNKVRQATLDFMDETTGMLAGNSGVSAHSNDAITEYRKSLGSYRRTLKDLEKTLQEIYDTWSEITSSHKGGLVLLDGLLHSINKTIDTLSLELQQAKGHSKHS